MSKIFKPMFETEYSKMNQQEIDSLPQLEINILYDIFLTLTLNRMIELLKKCIEFGWITIFAKRITQYQYINLFKVASESPIYKYYSQLNESANMTIYTLIHFHYEGKLNEDNIKIITELSKQNKILMDYH